MLHDLLHPMTRRGGGAASRGRRRRRCSVPCAQVPGRLLPYPAGSRRWGGKAPLTHPRWLQAFLSHTATVSHHKHKVLPEEKPYAAEQSERWPLRTRLNPLLRKWTHTHSSATQIRFIIPLKKFRLQGRTGTLGLRRPRYCPYRCQRPAGEPPKTYFVYLCLESQILKRKQIRISFFCKVL